VPEWAAVIALGVIEGITEFLPVSSTGHLLLAENTGLLPRQSDFFNVVIQSGTAVAVGLAFSKRLRELAARRHEPATRSFLLKLAMAFIITVVGGSAARGLGVTLPREAAPLAWATLIGGVVILLVERWLRGKPLRADVTWGIAAAVGLAQLVAAVFPGTSRSGATILVALALGLGRAAATEFSFLLGVPTLLAAGGYEALHAMRHPDPVATGWALVLLGTAVSTLAALVTVRWLLRFVQTHTFVGFGWYRIALGLVILVAPRGSA
jgi:undecaprenyl-diphosphatase